MLQSVNIDWDFFLGKISCVCVTYISLKQEDTYYMSIVDLTNTGIWEGTWLLISLYFSNLILIVMILSL